MEEYKKTGEPPKADRAKNWDTAIGLQEVDGLKPSRYLLETARANIDGDITIDEVKSRLKTYYDNKPSVDTERVEEADKVSARIAEILAEKTFTLSPAEYLDIHKRLFFDIYPKIAGKIRDYNITKEEWALGGDTVFYASANSLGATLEYDMMREKSFVFKGLSTRQIVEHLVFFVSNLWQIHVFGEGNTRATAVFLIKYLRALGFADVDNEVFSKNSWYFRNALVRANYENIVRGVHKTDEYLMKFFGNMLLGQSNILKNKDLLI